MFTYWCRLLFEARTKQLGKTISHTCYGEQSNRKRITNKVQNMVLPVIFNHRFIRSIFPFGILLKSIGICLHLNPPFKWLKQLVFFVCGSICFTISFQAGLQIFLDKGLLNIRYVFSTNSTNFPKGFSRMDALSKFVETTSSFFCGSFTYVMLAATARTTITQFCASLERIDCLAVRPDLTSLRRHSIVALVWILFTV